MRLIKQSKYYKSILTLGLPVVLAQLGQITVGIADNMMIGHIPGNSTDPLAAASFANTLFTLTILFGTGFSYIITPLIGNAFGQNKPQKIPTLFANGLASNAIVGVALTILLFILSKFMGSMGQPPQIIDMARQYMFILMASILPMMGFFAFKQYAEGIGNTKVSMLITIAANLINVAVNYLLIYGKLGFPELGLLGAGIGTLISRIFMLLAAMWWFYRTPSLKKHLPSIAQVNITLAGMKPFFRMGLASGGQIVMESSAFALSTVMMGWLGAQGLAAHQIGISISTLGFMVYQGIGAATTIRISQLKGGRNITGMRNTMAASVHILLLMVICMGSFFFLSRHWLPSLFTTNAEVINLASQFLIVLAIYQLPDALMLIYGFALRGLADVLVPALITLVSLFAISLSVSYLSAFVWGYNEIGIWFGFPLGLSAGAILLIWRFTRKLKRYQKAWAIK
ncbi:MATE family efflux transporter [Saccharicrinis aurantiacus]|uniref:MATE family efflux transporter n=1 Tax=Saccharicrinis aurantiacus TaxID=1849719 RepID=UPI00094FD52D|nr:MATE family efflux transporter [Saccharicrinis aurantiacus]